MGRSSRFAEAGGQVLVLELPLQAGARSRGEESRKKTMISRDNVIPDGPGADPWADPSKQQAQ